MTKPWVNTAPVPRSANEITRLSLGTLPQTMRRHTQRIRKYRRALEAAVIEAKGGVSTLDSHLIDEAATSEMHSAVCLWLLRSRLDKMTPSDITRCSEQILKSRRARNKAVAALKIDASEAKPWETIDAE